MDILGIKDLVCMLPKRIGFSVLNQPTSERAPMPDNNTDPSRRNFFKISAIGLAVAPFTNLVMSTTVQAAAGKRDVPVEASALSEDDPQAKALHYVEEAATANAVGRKDGQYCYNCQLYSGQADAEWGPCAIFSYRTNPQSNRSFVVSAQGWCQGWGPRAIAR